MIHFRSDRSTQPIEPSQVTTLRVEGPLASMTGRSTFHLTKSEALALAAWLGVEVDRPALETVPGPSAAPTG